MEHKPKHKYKLDLGSVGDEEEQKSFSFIECPSCGDKVGADKININDKIANCNSCGAVFSFEAEITKIKTSNKLKEKVEMPKGIEKFYFGDEMELTLPQTVAPWEAWALPLIPLVGLLFMMSYKEAKIPMMVPIILLMLLAIPIVSMINLKRHKTQLRINSAQITVDHLPKKLRKDKSFNVSDTDQIYTHKYSDMNGAQAYGLKIVINGMNGQEHLHLLKGIKTMREAKYIEQEIEGHLGIKNKSVIEEAKEI